MTTAQRGAGDLARQLSADLASHFEPLLVAYQDRLYSFALRLSGNPQDAEEIAQDAFVRAYRALRTYPVERIAALALRPWLYRITLNVYRNRARRKRLALVAVDAAPEDEGAAELADAAQEPPEDAAVRSEQRTLLAAALAALPERHRVAVTLRFVEGLSYAEIASTLAQPVGTAKATGHRGIGRLWERMGGDGGGGG